MFFWVTRYILLFSVLFSEFGEIYGRLFDHKPVVRGEVNFFLREFEVYKQYLCSYVLTYLVTACVM